MKLAVSNLGWGSMDRVSVRALLAEHGISGVELAPTAIWAGAPDVDSASLVAEADFWNSGGLAVSGVQSLLFGRPELQLFDASSHEALLDHLAKMIRVAGSVGARYAVFGSPKNRVRGHLDVGTADQVAASFFSRLIPILQLEGVVLTLEPNAPAYGADYLTDYESCVRLSQLVGSEYVKPQVDTGCLSMSGVDSAGAVLFHTPSHVHVSAPMLGPPPSGVDHQAVRSALDVVHYDRWCTLEMLASEPADVQQVLTSTVVWFHAIYGSGA